MKVTTITRCLHTHFVYDVKHFATKQQAKNYTHAWRKSNEYNVAMFKTTPKVIATYPIITNYEKVVTE